MNGVLQGTTPTLIIEIPEQIPVRLITAAELTIKQTMRITLYHLADLAVDTEDNTLRKAFTEQETLALDPASPLMWQLRIQTPDGIFGTIQQRITVHNLISEEAIR